ncbi:hypothetical protein DH2020_037025 [Rehmannia glutinosa]|uniref:UBL3-like ubiquitin domain-containing protein n=1 Tax=Rehmannia glutinosa TaxID=99300 RepID=A0ABR0V420_REHGL
MSGAQDQLEIKFRLTDGSDIGPKNFSVATSVATLKENIIAQWPKERKWSAYGKGHQVNQRGKNIREQQNGGECRSPLCDIQEESQPCMFLFNHHQSEKMECLGTEIGKFACLCNASSGKCAVIVKIISRPVSI